MSKDKKPKPKQKPQPQITTSSTTTAATTTISTTASTDTKQTVITADTAVEHDDTKEREHKHDTPTSAAPNVPIEFDDETDMAQSTSTADLMQHDVVLKSLESALHSSLTLPGSLVVHHVNVGNGNLTIVDFPGTKIYPVIIDAGTRTTAGTVKKKLEQIRKEAKAYVARLFQARVDQDHIPLHTIRYLVLSHDDDDHISLVSDLFPAETWTVSHILIGGIVSGSKYLTHTSSVGQPPLSFGRWFAAMQRKGINIKTFPFKFNQRHRLRLHSGLDQPPLYSVSIVTANAEWNPEKPNNHSLVVMVENGDFREFIMGDAEMATEQLLVQNKHLKKIVKRCEKDKSDSCTVLVTGHHGSAHSSLPGLLTFLRPRAFVFSGNNNNYAHPNFDAVDRAYRSADIAHFKVPVTSFSSASYEEYTNDAVNDDCDDDDKAEPITPVKTIHPEHPVPVHAAATTSHKIARSMSSITIGSGRDVYQGIVKYDEGRNAKYSGWSSRFLLCTEALGHIVIIAEPHHACRILHGRQVKELVYHSAPIPVRQQSTVFQTLIDRLGTENYELKNTAQRTQQQLEQALFGDHNSLASAISTSTSTPTSSASSIMQHLVDDPVVKKLSSELEHSLNVSEGALQEHKQQPKGSAEPAIPATTPAPPRTYQ